MSNYCCEMMEDNLTKECNSGDELQHTNRFDCPDVILARFEKSGTTGIIIHDGGSSIIKIDYCPWCGSKLEKKT